MTAMAATVQGSSRLDSGEGRSIRPHPSPPPCVTSLVGVVCAPVPRELGACALLLLVLGASCTRGGGTAGAPSSPPSSPPTAATPDRSSPAVATQTASSAAGSEA